MPAWWAGCWDAGADVDAATAEGAYGAQTALMWAVAQSHPSVVEVLLAHGADVRARSTTFTETVKTISTYANYGLQCVPRDECYITEVRSGGFTPLLFAARVGDVASARLLVAAGADVNEAAARRSRRAGRRGPQRERRRRCAIAG